MLYGEDTTGTFKHILNFASVQHVIATKTHTDMQQVLQPQQQSRSFVGAFQTCYENNSCAFSELPSLVNVWLSLGNLNYMDKVMVRS